MLKMKILSSIWGAQHPNADQNIQHFSDENKRKKNGQKVGFKWLEANSLNLDNTQKLDTKKR